jgi:iron(III) transport system permease protein
VKALVPDAQILLTCGLLALLAAFVLYSLAQVLYVALWGPDGLTAGHLLAFFERPLFQEALLNTLVAGVTAVALGSCLTLPLAYCSVRYRFPGKAILQTLGVLPLVIPPFVGAVALQLLLGRNGSLNLLLLDTSG